MKNRSENSHGREQFLTILQGNSRTIAQKSGENWAGQADLQPISLQVRQAPRDVSNPLPDWAIWLAQDADGAWWCYEAEPNQHDTGWYENEVGRIEKVGQGAPNPHWREALVKLTNA